MRAGGAHRWWMECWVGRLEERVPDESTIRKLTRRLGPEVVDDSTCCSSVSPPRPVISAWSGTVSLWPDFRCSAGCRGQVKTPN